MCLSAERQVDERAERRVTRLRCVEGVEAHVGARGGTWRGSVCDARGVGRGCWGRGGGSGQAHLQFWAMGHQFAVTSSPRSRRRGSPLLSRSRGPRGGEVRRALSARARGARVLVCQRAHPPHPRPSPLPSPRASSSQARHQARRSSGRNVSLSGVTSRLARRYHSRFFLYLFSQGRMLARRVFLMVSSWCRSSRPSASRSRPSSARCWPP